MSPDRYAGLPADLAPPARTASAIAALDTAVAREALLARVPAQWRAWVERLAIVAIAARIVGTPGLERRRALLPEVPERWRPEVTAHVRRMWAVAALRAADEARAAEAQAG